VWSKTTKSFTHRPKNTINYPKIFWSFSYLADGFVSISVMKNNEKLQTQRLTGLFAISGCLGKASGWIFGGFGGDFRVVFDQFSEQISVKNH